MIKIFIGNQSDKKIGGGFRFIENFKKVLGGKIELVERLEDCNIFFIPSSSMIKDTEIVERAKIMDKRIILRVDNVLRDSRNRGCGMGRMKRIAEISDKIIYQSHWARNYLSDFLCKNGAVIHNGCDLSIFNPDGEKLPKEEGLGEIYLYSRYGRDETKCWHEVYYEFQKLYKENSSRKLWIIGNFSPELVKYNFDFFRGEKFEYFGIIDNAYLMATLYRTADYLIFPYYNDACSNTYIEARCCGTKIYMTKSGATGGTIELLNKDNIPEDFSLEKMGNKYLKLFSEIYCV